MGKKNKDIFLEHNGYYWVSILGHDPEIAQYDKSSDGFHTIEDQDVFYTRNCKILSDIILRPTSKD